MSISARALVLSRFVAKLSEVPAKTARVRCFVYDLCSLQRANVTRGSTRRRIQAAPRWFVASSLFALLILFSPLSFADDPPIQPHTSDDIPGEIAVDLVDDLSNDQVDAFAHDFGVKLEPVSVLTASTRIHEVDVPAAEVDSWIARMRGDARVEVVEPIARVHASWVPNDPMLDKQWHLDRVGAPSAWSYATGRGVTVAVVDTGIACEDHGPFSRGTDLADSWCRTGFNFVDKNEHANDDNGHGTHVAGTIAQSTNNALGGAGLAFHARLMPVKVLNGQGYGTTTAVADGIRFAADAGAHVINLSLGGGRASRVMLSAIRHARSKGVLVVAAAGNNGRSVEYPGAFEEVLAVSATDSNDRLAPFSSRGPQVGIAAPGVNVLQQTICNGGRDKCEKFAALSGTSMASPHVAAAAALVMSLGVTDPVRVRAILTDAAVPPKGESKGGPRFGAGILDAAGAVSSTAIKQVLTRFGLIALLTALIVRGIRRRKHAVNPWRPSYWVAALAFGTGLLFFLPFMASRVPLALDLLARPIPEWDMLAGLSVHRWLPLAHFFVPLGFSALLFSIRRARPFVAGTAIGTAAYLASIPLLQLQTSTVTSTAMLGAWALVNVVGCIWLAHLNLDETETAA